MPDKLRHKPRAYLFNLLALLMAMAMVAAACGGDDDGGDEGADPGDTTSTTEEDAGEPQPGGSITVGLEAETNGWSPHQGNWASSGYVVAHSIYDPLMARTEGGEIEPYLAESLTPTTT